MTDQIPDTLVIETPPSWVCAVCESPMGIVDRVPATPKSKEAHFGYCPNCGRPEFAERPEPRVPTNNHEVLEAIDEVIHRPQEASNERILEIVEIIRDYDELLAKRGFGGLRYIPIEPTPKPDGGVDAGPFDPEDSDPQPCPRCGSSICEGGNWCDEPIPGDHYAGEDARVGSIDDLDPMAVER